MRFSLHSVFLPNREDSADSSTGEKEDEELEGVIVSFSDSGASLKAFAVVEVVGRPSLVVPVEDLRPVAQPGPGLGRLKEFMSYQIQKGWVECQLP